VVVGYLGSLGIMSEFIAAVILLIASAVVSAEPAVPFEAQSVISAGYWEHENLHGEYRRCVADEAARSQSWQPEG